MYIIERKSQDGNIIDSKKRPFLWMANKAFAELVLNTRMATGVMAANGGIKSDGTVDVKMSGDQNITTVNIGDFTITCRKT